MPKKTIANYRGELERLLAPFSGCPSNRRAKIIFRPADDERRAIREDADASYFDPLDGCYLRIEFVERVLEEPQPERIATLPMRKDERTYDPSEDSAEFAAPRAVLDDGLLARIVLALDRAERAPNRSFVAIKSFRDRTLPGEGLRPDEAAMALNRAIAEGLIRTSKIPNPNNPAFPTTTVRLDRSNPRVAALLSGTRPEAETRRPRFSPRNFGAVSASEIVIRDRR